MSFISQTVALGPLTLQLWQALLTGFAGLIVILIIFKRLTRGKYSSSTTCNLLLYKSQRIQTESFD